MWSANSLSFTSSSISSARWRRSALPQSFSSSGSSMFFVTVRHSNSPACWNAIP